MLCPKCNTMNLDSDNFCIKCGAPLPAPVQQSAAPHPPAGQQYPISQQPAAYQQSGGQPYPISQQPAAYQPSAGQPYPISQQPAAPQPPVGQTYPISGHQPVTSQQPTGQPYPISQQPAAPQPPAGQTYPISGHQPVISQQPAGQAYPISQQPAVSQPSAGQPYPTSGQYSAAPQQTAGQPKPTFYQPLASPQTPPDQQYIPPVQRNTAPQYPGQPYTAAQKSPAQPAQQEPAPKSQANPAAQDFPQYTEAAPSAPASAEKQKKSRKGVVAVILAIVVVLLAAGGFLYVKFFWKNNVSTETDAAKATTEDAATAETADETTSQPAETTLQSDETTEADELSAQSATAGPFSELHGRWLDQSGDFEMYITSDGTFDLVMPEGLFTGQLEKSGTEYQMKKISKPEYLRNSFIVLHQEGSRPSIELRTEGVSAVLDFESIPEKDENTDWFLLKPGSETESRFPYCDKLLIDSDQSSSEWMLIASYPMRDVKILALDQVYGSSDDEATYETQVQNSVSAILSRRPLILRISLAGDTPTKGVSFVGVDGKTHRFAFSYNEDENTVTCEEF